MTFRYFSGLAALCNSNYAKAEKELALAFTACPACAKSKRAILGLLVPVRVLKVTPSTHSGVLSASHSPLIACSRSSCQLFTERSQTIHSSSTNYPFLIR